MLETPESSSRLKGWSLGWKILCDIFGPGLQTNRWASCFQANLKMRPKKTWLLSFWKPRKLLRQWEAMDVEVVALWKDDEWRLWGFEKPHEKGVAFLIILLRIRPSYLLGKVLSRKSFKRCFFIKKDNGSGLGGIGRQKWLDESWCSEADALRYTFTKIWDKQILKYEDF